MQYNSQYNQPCKPSCNHKAICIWASILIVISLATIIFFGFLLRHQPTGITLQLENKRAATILEDEAIKWDEVTGMIDDKIEYDPTTGEITIHKTGYYYINYFFNILPGTISCDFSFDLEDLTTAEVLVSAQGSGSNSGSPTSYVSSQLVMKLTAGETLHVSFTSNNDTGLLLGDTPVQGNITIVYLGQKCPF